LVLVPRGLHAEYMLGDAAEALLEPLLAFVARAAGVLQSPDVTSRGWPPREPAGRA
jgi:hypothetical protein